MKKFLTLSLLLAAAVFAVPSAQAKTNNVTGLVSANAAEPQVRVQIGPNRRNRRIRNNRVRVVNRVRIVRYGRQRYPETIQIRYLPNGRTQTRVLSRYRIR